MTKRVSVEDARSFFEHKSQQIFGITPQNLPETGCEYWVSGGLCVALHGQAWPGVYMAHYGAKPEFWGRLVEPAKDILAAFWAEKEPQRIIGWTAEGNRPALAFARRIGFEIDGKLKLPSGNVIMQGYSQWE